MKRFIACLVALVICVSMVLPVAVSAAPFTPSVTNKPSPDIVPVIDPNGNPALGAVWNWDEIIGYAYDDCLIVTAVADALTSTEIPAEARDFLLSVYEKLLDGSMKLPYDKLGLDADKMVIRDLFDVTLLCDGTTVGVDHMAMLEPTGVVLKVTFDLGVAADAKVYALTYKNEAWNPIADIVNNGDGTVTCTFEHLCPVAFAVEVAEEDTPSDRPSETGDPAGENLMMWVIIASVSLVAVVALVVIYRTKLSKES